MRQPIVSKHRSPVLLLASSILLAACTVAAERPPVTPETASPPAQTTTPVSPEVLRAQVQRLGAVMTRRLEPDRRGDDPAAKGGGVWFGRDVIVTAHAVVEPLVEGGHARANAANADLSLRRIADTSGQTRLAVMGLDPYVDQFVGEPDPVPVICDRDPTSETLVWVATFAGVQDATWKKGVVASAVELPHGAPIFDPSTGCLLGLTDQAGKTSAVIGRDVVRSVVAHFGLPRKSD